MMNDELFVKYSEQNMSSQLMEISHFARSINCIKYINKKINKSGSPD